MHHPDGVSTTRRPGAAGAVHAVSTSLSGSGAALTVSVPAVISAARAGSSATIAAVLDGALAAAHDAQVRGAQRGGRERDVRAGDGADLDPVERAAAVAAAGDERADRALGGRAPEVVEDDVDVGGRLAERVVVERDGDVGAGRRAPRGARRRGRRRSPAPAPRCLAISTAIRPALPVAPRTSTRCPGWSAIRVRSAIHEDIAGFIAAAIVAASLPAGSGTLRRRSTTVRSAIDPSVVSGRTK